MKKNSVGHFEIYANDPDKLQQFYTSLFDWNVAAVQGMDYRFITTVDVDEQGRPTTPGGINGGRLERPAGYDARALGERRERPIAGRGGPAGDGTRGDAHEGTNRRRRHGLVCDAGRSGRQPIRGVADGPQRTMTRGFPLFRR
jgi:hypothetical protein